MTKKIFLITWPTFWPTFASNAGQQKGENRLLSNFRSSFSTKFIVNKVIFKINKCPYFKEFPSGQWNTLSSFSFSCQKFSKSALCWILKILHFFQNWYFQAHFGKILKGFWFVSLFKFFLQFLTAYGCKMGKRRFMQWYVHFEQLLAMEK